MMPVYLYVHAPLFDYIKRQILSMYPWIKVG